MYVSETWCKLKVKLQNYPSIIAFLNYYVTLALHFRYGIRYQRECFYRIVGAKPILERLFNDACGSLFGGFVTMNSDKDTRRGTSPEKVNEFHREMWERRCYSVVFWWRPSAIELDKVLDSGVMTFHRFFLATTWRDIPGDMMFIYWREKKGKAALSIELLINNDWTDRIYYLALWWPGHCPTHRISWFNLRHYGTVICLRIASKLLRVRIQLSSTPE